MGIDPAEAQVVAKPPCHSERQLSVILRAKPPVILRAKPLVILRAKPEGSSLRVS